MTRSTYDDLIICSKLVETVTFDLYPGQGEAPLAWLDVVGDVVVSASSMYPARIAA